MPPYDFCRNVIVSITRLTTAKEQGRNNIANRPTDSVTRFEPFRLGLQRELGFA
jgi:hypothetical protein